MLNKKIDYLHTPEVRLEILFAVWSEKIMQCWRSAGALGDRFQKLRRRLRDTVVAQQRFAERRRGPFRAGDLFIPCGPHRVYDFIHELRIVCGVYRKRIADLKAQSPPGQVEFEMARIL